MRERRYASGSSGGGAPSASTSSGLSGEYGGSVFSFSCGAYAAASRH